MPNFSLDPANIPPPLFQIAFDSEVLYCLFFTKRLLRQIYLLASNALTLLKHYSTTMAGRMQCIFLLAALAASVDNMALYIIVNDGSMTIF